VLLNVRAVLLGMRYHFPLFQYPVLSAVAKKNAGDIDCGEREGEGDRVGDMVSSKNFSLQISLVSALKKWYGKYLN
jgi:hypothetical protein